MTQNQIGHFNRKSLTSIPFGEPIGRSEGFPSRDIWSLGVMLPGPSQMERVLGTPPSPPSLGGQCLQVNTRSRIIGGQCLQVNTRSRIIQGFRQNLDLNLTKYDLNLTNYEQKCNFLKIRMSKKSKHSYFLKIKGPTSHQALPSILPPQN